MAQVHMFFLPTSICRAVVQMLCLDSNLDSRKKILDSIWIVLANDLDSCNFHKVATLLCEDALIGQLLTRVANLVTRLPDLVTFADIPVTNFFEFFSYHMSLSLSLIVFSVAFLTILYERERERHEIEWRERQRERPLHHGIRRSHS